MTDIDWSGCSIVQVDPQKLGGTPTVRAWRLSADSIIENYDCGETEGEIAAMFRIPLEDVHTIVAYAQRVRNVAHSLE